MSTDRDDAFDALIDETARELTAGPSPAKLRETVRARTRNTRRAGPFGPAGWDPFGPAGWDPFGRAGSRIPIWQPALGAAALAILIVALIPPDGQGPAVPAPSVNAPSRPEVGVPPRVAAEGIRPSGTVEQARPSGIGAGRQRVTAASSQVAVPPDPLPAIEPLAIEPVLMERTVIDTIAPMPLGIEQLEIERLFLE